MRLGQEVQALPRRLSRPTGLVLAFVAVTALALVAIVRIWPGQPLWRPPEVAPLGRDAGFSADVVLALADGYVVAGVVGTREPDEAGTCSGRFALVEVGVDGAPRSAIVASGLEPDRWCANEVESLVPTGDGGWVISGVGRSEHEPSFDEPGTRGERLTLRISSVGEPGEDFGDRGVLHKTVVVGRVRGELITDELTRVTQEGDVRDDVLLQADSVRSTWTDAFAFDDEVVVAVREFGRSLQFQSFGVVPTARQFRLRPLRPPVPLDVCESKAPCTFAGAELHEGRLYVLQRPYQSLGGLSLLLIAIDPRRWSLVPTFGESGLATIPGLTDAAPAAFAVEKDGNIVVAGTTTTGKLGVARLSGDGSVDTGFDGAMSGTATRVAGAGAAQVVIDAVDRVVVLDASGVSLVRLTQDGRRDPSFGADGLVELGGIRVCGLEPGRSASVCAEG